MNSLKKVFSDETILKKSVSSIFKGIEDFYKSLIPASDKKFENAYLFIKNQKFTNYNITMRFIFLYFLAKMENMQNYYKTNPENHMNEFIPSLKKELDIFLQGKYEKISWKYLSISQFTLHIINKFNARDFS